jgi:hypothetical protein
MFSPDGLKEVVDPFTALASGIIGQQVCLAPTLILRDRILHSEMGRVYRRCLLAISFPFIHENKNRENHGSI